MKTVLYADRSYNIYKSLASYVFPVGPAERWMGETRSMEQIMEDENDNWTYYK